MQEQNENSTSEDEFGFREILADLNTDLPAFDQEINAFLKSGLTADTLDAFLHSRTAGIPAERVHSARRFISARIADLRNE